MIQPGEISLYPGGCNPEGGRPLGCLYDRQCQITYQVGARETPCTTMFYLLGPRDLPLEEVPWARMEELLKYIFLQARRENPDSAPIAGELSTGEWCRFYREVLPTDGADHRVRGIYQFKLGGKATFHEEEDEALIELLASITHSGFPYVETLLGLHEILARHGRGAVRVPGRAERRRIERRWERRSMAT
ncbi:uncharacterized protein BO95DRAFT_465032 [Aspergillus brunneoviolaceus CBS 621.78]|uniref:Uncharacterized protein n=2 Tax=Aspergillus TaxID=5052 RepID=A0A8G1S0P6_9EURO|nr:hypothetical protein BO95DRAFT_465032 [Aspergillus brunneoviolaceus CBS 621.78]XP_040806389.1 uncharacterized protein BO72DRAFT_443834 [Aspergillus fijiensis CBS 313.89]RAH44328.1 hypothetical protein BO95DRAFT_465032 [Aspergillus brunneoviolaceus CBS 621.78]RAK82379.1 hypothetical protein BO72DRAFT_443834 [Aspergillus fijiensis CBS 313.89]